MSCRSSPAMSYLLKEVITTSSGAERCGRDKLRDASIRITSFACARTRRVFSRASSLSSCRRQQRAPGHPLCCESTANVYSCRGFATGWRSENQPRMGTDDTDKIRITPFGVRCFSTRCVMVGGNRSHWSEIRYPCSSVPIRGFKFLSCSFGSVSRMNRGFRHKNTLLFVAKSWASTRDPPTR